MGIAANHKSDTQKCGFEDYWPDKYKDYANFIIGIILFVEAKNVGIDISNKDTTLSFNTFLDPNQGQNYLFLKDLKRQIDMQ